MLALLGACTPGTGTGLFSNDEGGSSEGGEATPPAFLGAADEIRVPVTRTSDLEIEVRGVAVARTRLVVDPDQRPDMTTLTRARLGALEHDRLRLHLDGGAIPSLHVLRLDDGYGKEMLSSGELTIRFEAAEPPQVTATIEAEPWAEADAIVTDGVDVNGVLARLDFRIDPPVAALHRMHRSGFADDAFATIALPGLRARQGTRPWLTLAYVPGDETMDDRVRAAWTEGNPGIAVRWFDAAVDELADAAPEIAVSLTDIDTAGSEFTAFGRPLWIGDTLVIELARDTDVERPRPGDRVLLSAAIDGPGRLAPVYATRVLGTVSLADIEPAIDPAALRWPHPRLFAARVDARWPILLGVDATGHIVADPRPSAEEEPWDDIHGSIVLSVGPFGARIAAACTSAGLRVAWLDAVGSIAVVDRVLEIPDCRRLAATRVGGAMLVLVARGPDVPVAAVWTADTSPAVHELGTVRCDEIAMPQSQVLNTGSQVPFVCRRERVLLRGTIELVPE